MQGTRVEYAGEGPLPEPGAYWKMDGHWYGLTPNGALAGLANHTITEYADGTITVAPSILVHRSEHFPAWHGFLERGIWREC